MASFDAIMGVDSVTSLHSRISKMSVRNTSPESPPIAEATGPTFQDDLANPGSLSPVTDQEASNEDSLLSTKSDGDPPVEVPGVTVTSATGENEMGVVCLNPSDSQPSDVLTDLPSADTAVASHPPPSLVEFTEANLTDFSVNTQHFIPDVVESSQQEGGEQVPGSDSPGDGSLPSILADLTPQNFSIKGNGKQRMSKADFLGGKSSLGTSQSESDPLSSLDPLWTIKSKGKAENAPLD